MEMNKKPEQKKRLTIPEVIFADQIVAIDKRLSEIAQHTDNMEVEVRRLNTRLDVTKLLKHIVSQTGKPVATKLEDIPENDYYATIRMNAERFGYRLQELQEAKKKLFTMQNSNIVSELHEVAKALQEELVPIEKGKKDVVSFLIEDTLELIEILEQTDAEVRTFDALCRFVQSLPEEEKDKIRNA